MYKRQSLERPPDRISIERIKLSGDNPFSGSEVAELSPFLAQELRLPVNRKGIAILAVERGSRAARYGFRPGDIITSIGRNELTSVAQFQDILSKGALVWRFELIRDGQRIRQILR